MRLDRLDRSVVILVVGATCGAIAVGDCIPCAVVELLAETSLVWRLGDGFPENDLCDGDSSFDAGLVMEDRLDKGMLLEAS